jgi:hypothetical protein
VTRTLGILMLDTAFPRPLGDVGHPASWAIPVRYRVVPGAGPARVVQAADESLLEPFIAAARELVHEGASAITTSCGFLVRWQRALQQALPVPVWTSSLLALPGLARPGVVTVDARSLGAAELQAAGAQPDIPVQGLEQGSHLQTTLLQNRPWLDLAMAEADAVGAAQALLARHPHIESIVFECTNLAPYEQAVRDTTGLPVHHLVSFVHECWERQE